MATVADSPVELNTEALKFGEDVASRVIYGNWAPWEHNLLLKGEYCSLALDTPWFNGHTTTYEMTWAGIPVITYPQGELFFSRLGASIVNAVGMELNSEFAPGQVLVVRNLQEYEEVSVRLLHQPRHLATVANHIRAGRLGSGLTSLDTWVKHYETGMFMWWDIWTEFGESKFFHVSVAS